jgi:hypothetical protein
MCAVKAAGSHVGLTHQLRHGSDQAKVSDLSDVALIKQNVKGLEVEMEYRRGCAAVKKQ